MALVDYSDSEESEIEQSKPAPLPKCTAKPTGNFSLDRANNKIRVRLDDTPQSNVSHEDEPAAKKPRIGGGGFSGFNSFLPPPKRDADAKPQTTTKAAARKVFSLKTGAEPGFSREADAELKHFFAQQETESGTSSTRDDEEVGIPNLPKKMPETETEAPQQTVKGNAFMFKPLSVGRSTKKKRPITGTIKAETTQAEPIAHATPSEPVADPPPPPPKKASLFSMHEKPEAGPMPMPEHDEAPDGIDLDPDPIPDINTTIYNTPNTQSNPNPNPEPEPESLASLATTLNLTPSQRRQLLGRHSTTTTTTTKSNPSAIKITNFSTDAEYLANETLRSTTDAAATQHNPLRGIAPGKHSLRQLVNSAVTQKDALEESFASGKRNKRDVGNRYGWG